MSGVVVEMFDRVALIRLARGNKLNALDMPMLAALSDAADRIDAHATLRMAVLTGSGKAFCVGGDVTAWSALDPLAMGQRWVREGHRVFDKLARLRVPLIAVLNGHALGGGLAEAALHLGLVDQVVPVGEGLARAMAIARGAGARGRTAVVLAKQMINAAEGEEDGAVVEVLAGSLVSYTDELREGVAAFRERRALSFE